MVVPWLPTEYPDAGVVTGVVEVGLDRTDGATVVGATGCTVASSSVEGITVVTKTGRVAGTTIVSVVRCVVDMGVSVDVVEVEIVEVTSEVVETAAVVLCSTRAAAAAAADALIACPIAAALCIAAAAAPNVGCEFGSTVGVVLLVNCRGSRGALNCAAEIRVQNEANTNLVCIVSSLCLCERQAVTVSDCDSGKESV